MRKAVLALTAILLIICLIESMTQILIVKANFIPAPAVAIDSPKPYFIKIYQNSTVPLKIEVRVLRNSPEINYVRYSLDGKANVTLTDFKKGDLMAFSPGAEGYVLWTESTLVNLADGNHTLKAYAFYDDVHYAVMSTSELFTVDTTYRYPTVTIISPLNQTYTQNEIPLTYAVDEEIQWAYYKLDGHWGNFNYSFYENTTLTGLSEGSHKILVSVFTVKGNANPSQMTYFNVNTTKTDNPLTMSNQTNLILIAIVISVVVVASVSLVYLKRRNTHEKK